MATKRDRAKGRPQKTFFVTMITRDISLEDCIFDLIDNSIDSAWEISGHGELTLDDKTDLSQYKIDLKFSEEGFEIYDNCGGLQFENARDYAFSFGRDPSEETDDYSIGIYGIGMKRAIFKIGQKISITSTHKEEELDSFSVPISVWSWLKSENWDFTIYEANHLPEPGVNISIKNLYDEVSQLFESPRFLSRVRHQISRDYTLFLQRGLTVTVNGKPVEGWDIQLKSSSDFYPLRQVLEHQYGDEEVRVEILAGMADEPPDENDPTDNSQDSNRYGWYVVCNGRIVLAADTSEVSGWGTEEWPKWHPQYSGFIGIALFTAKNPALLPLTTTKRSVDQTSRVFRNCRPNLREASKAWIAYTNNRKKNLDKSKEREQQAKKVSLSSIAASNSLKVPSIGSAPKGEPQANVNYSVPRKKMLQLASAMGKRSMSYRDVGIKSFDYAFDDLVGDE